VGANVTLIVQFPAAAMLAPQVLVSAKSPLAAMLVMVIDALPEFVRVTFCGLEVEPTSCPVKVREFVERAGSGACPVPLSVTVCVFPAAALLLSAIVRVPLRLPSAVGVNVTLIVQFPFADTLEPQVSVWAKSPLAAMLVIMSGALPEFVRVSVCGLEAEPTAWPAKVRLAGNPVACGVPTPVPIKASVWGLPGALSVIWKALFRTPPSEGVKVMPTLQLAPMARVSPQWLTAAKSPPAAIPVIVSGMLPGLYKVTFSLELDTPSTWLPKLSGAGYRATVGALR
jgi:hypothetical protein